MKSSCACAWSRNGRRFLSPTPWRKRCFYPRASLFWPRIRGGFAPPCRWTCPGRARLIFAKRRHSRRWSPRYHTRFGERQLDEAAVDCGGKCVGSFCRAAADLAAHSVDLSRAAVHVAFAVGGSQGCGCALPVTAGFVRHYRGRSHRRNTVERCSGRWCRAAVRAIALGAEDVVSLDVVAADRTDRGHRAPDFDVDGRGDFFRYADCVHHFAGTDHCESRE